MELSARFSKQLRDPSTRGPGLRLEVELKLSAARSFVLFGPSGAGKSTLLRCIAGLLTPDSGTVRFGPESWFDSGARRNVRPQLRRLGYLSQNSALFPHLSVGENLRFAAISPEAPAQWFGVAALEHRYPSQLSAGERQRVALARTLATRPRLLLLDEPFSALDQPSRESLRIELKRALVESGVPSILVTHDRAEALFFAEELALLHAGKIRQVGAAAQVFARPQDLDVARAVGFETFLAAEAVRAAGLSDVPAPGSLGCVRGEDIQLLPEARAREASAQGVAILRGRIEGISDEGPLVRVSVNVGFPVVAILSKRESDALTLSTGMEVSACIRNAAIHWLAD